ncbi:hypothetical protein ACH4MG_27135 [Streptomyces sp. NPDC017454]|uniref:hypothetical protein n=1 Tax=Streptomyces sp. NPDC017454 TaxID=3364997 RepID=UPI0037A73ED7
MSSYDNGGWLKPGWLSRRHANRRPEPVTRPEPDQRRIAQLERELGIGQPNPELERGIREDRTICLIKDCDGSTEEIRTWSGLLMRRVHLH